MSAEAHARLGPSNHRWPNCPGSPREEAKYENIAGTAAIDGTGSHLLLEYCLIHKCRAEDYLGVIIGPNHPDKPNGWMVHQDRCDRVQVCLDYVNARFDSLKDEYPGHKIEVEAEAKSDPGGMFGRDDWWGTCDITITVTNDHGRCVFMEVIDYKDGRMYVAVKGNTQFGSYLIGKLRPFVASGPELVRPHEWHKIGNDCRMTVVQPKTDPPIRSEDITSTEIGEWAEDLNIAARATDEPDAPLIPDDKGGKGYCKWCLHKDNCTATGERGLEELKTMTDNLPVESGSGDFFELGGSLMSNAQNLPVDQLLKIVDMEPSVMSIFDQARAELLRRVESEPGSVPGWAMKPGQGKNVWVDKPAEIAKVLKGKRIKQDVIFPKTLITPAQFLKCKDVPKEKRQKIYGELVTFVAGEDKLTKVAVREKPSADEMFPSADFSAQDEQQETTEELSFK